MTPLAVVVAHWALPWLIAPLGTYLGRARRTAFRLLADAVRRHPVRTYGYGSIALGTVAILSKEDFKWLGGYPFAGAVVAIGAGAGLPLLLARIAGRPRRPFARRPPIADLVALPLVAAAEEILWRAVAFGVLTGAGLPALPAAAGAVAGFALLHVPYEGWRSVPYVLGFGALLTSLAATGGLLAAVVCHVTHNLVLATSVKARPPASNAEAPPLPPSQAWS